MNLNQLINRSTEIILNPKTEWEAITEETSHCKDVFTNFVLPYLLVDFLSSTIGISLFKHFSIVVSIAQSFIPIIEFVVILFLTPIIIEALGKLFNTEVSRNKAFKLVAYSFTPSYIINIIVGLLPFLHNLVILSLYGIYIMWVGFGSLLNTPQDKKIGYFIITLLILIGEMVILHFILFAIIIFTGIRVYS